MAVTNAADQAITNALAREANRLLGSQLDGTFSILSYPPGYNFLVQYGQPVLYNAATLGVIDQICTMGRGGAYILTGKSFSTLYLNILQNTIYLRSSTDQASLQALQQKFAAKQQAMISAFEADFGSITQAQIDGSKCFPATKVGYIASVVARLYGGDPQSIPPAYAGFASVYSDWITLGEQLTALAAQPAEAQKRLAAAMKHIQRPSAESDAWQLGTDRYGVAYQGLPSVTAITGSLTSTGRVLSMTVDLSDPGSCRRTGGNWRSAVSGGLRLARHAARSMH